MDDAGMMEIESGSLGGALGVLSFRQARLFILPQSSLSKARAGQDFHQPK